jgi:hypothetical protein
MRTAVIRGRGASMKVFGPLLLTTLALAGCAHRYGATGPRDGWYDDGYAALGQAGWYGWHDGYYYPGIGRHVYDRWRRRHGWTDAQRRYWESRRPDARGARLRAQWGAFGQNGFRYGEQGRPQPPQVRHEGYGARRVDAAPPRPPKPPPRPPKPPTRR